MMQNVVLVIKVKIYYYNIGMVEVKRTLSIVQGR